MYKVGKREIFALLFFISAGLHAVGAGLHAVDEDENLDHNLPEIMIEERLQQLEEDLNGNPYEGKSLLTQWDSEKGKYVPYVPKSDVTAIRALARNRLYSIPRSEYYGKNISLMRVEETRAIGDRVYEMALYHAAKRTANQRIINNAAKLESEELMNFLSKNPMRSGQAIKQYFGNNLKTRVASNIMSGKYGY